MKVAIIVPYFGKFPQWFDLYLYSCSKNSFVDFFFYTDCPVPHKTYSNTIFFKTDFKSYCERVSKILRIDFSPQNAYKLCDLKPFYGLIHEEDLKDYDFWGFADIDLVYGDLGIIINTQNLSNYDFITTHGGRVAGHLTVMRCDSKYTQICKSIPEWCKCLEDGSHNYILDEVALAYLIYPQLKTISRIYHYIVRLLHLAKEGSFYNWINRLYCNPSTRMLFWEYDTTPRPRLEDKWIYNWVEGMLYHEASDKQLPYLHFLLFKKNSYFELENFWDGDYYNISKECFEDKTSVRKLISISLDGIRFKK